MTRFSRGPMRCLIQHPPGGGSRSAECSLAGGHNHIGGIRSDVYEDISHRFGLRDGTRGASAP